MKKIYLLISAVIIALLFAACGDGVITESENSIKITLKDCNDYTQIISGDVVVSDEQSTTLTTILDANGSKSICVQSGSAHILR